jgi:hypothetical protein
LVVQLAATPRLFGSPIRVLNGDRGMLGSDLNADVDVNMADVAIEMATQMLRQDVTLQTTAVTLCKAIRDNGNMIKYSIPSYSLNPGVISNYDIMTVGLALSRVEDCDGRSVWVPGKRQGAADHGGPDNAWISTSTLTWGQPLVVDSRYQDLTESNRKYIETGVRHKPLKWPLESQTEGGDTAGGTVSYRTVERTRPVMTWINESDGINRDTKKRLRSVSLTIDLLEIVLASLV